MSRVKKRLRTEDFKEKTSVKRAAAKVSPSLAGILCHRLPDDMAHFTKGGRTWRLSGDEIKRRGELVYWGTGIIYECHRVDDDDDADADFASIIICPATLFFRTDSLQPTDIQVDVYLWDGTICQAQVIACDFHYNLAAVRIQTRYQLQTATVRDLDNSVPIKPNPLQQQQQQQLPPLRPHSTKSKISDGTHLITIARSKRLRNSLIVASGVFRASTLRQGDYSELYCVLKNDNPEKKGGAVINYHGEVIGLVFYQSSFLPINLVSIWWKNFRSFQQYHRPCLGVKIVNLHSTNVMCLREFSGVFPDVTGGAVVTEVAEDSPAFDSGISPEDVIIKCNGELVRSSLELFEIVWNKVGVEYVELDVLRARNGKKLKLSLKVEQTSQDKMYQWQRSPWTIFRPFEPEVQNLFLDDRDVDDWKPIVQLGVQE